MKKSNKKGFTIVELVIVIAVIAILAAVLIPTFSGLVKKANLSADKQAVREMNQALAADEPLNGKAANLDKAMQVLGAAGYNTNNWKCLTNGYEVYWYKTDNRCILYNKTTGKVEYPEEYNFESIYADGTNFFLYNHNEYTALKYDMSFSSSNNDSYSAGVGLSSVSGSSNFETVLGSNTALKESILGSTNVDAAKVYGYNKISSSSASGATAKLEIAAIANDKSKVTLSSTGEITPNFFYLSIDKGSTTETKEAEQKLGEYVYSIFTQVNANELVCDEEHPINVVIEAGTTLRIDDRDWKPIKLLNGYFGTTDAANPIEIVGLTMEALTYQNTYIMAGEGSKYFLSGFIGAVYGNSTVENITFKSLKIDKPATDAATAKFDKMGYSNTTAIIGGVINPVDKDVEANVTIRNIEVDANSKITSLARVGGIVGYIGGPDKGADFHGTVNIEHCKFAGEVETVFNVEGKGDYATAGGMVGFITRSFAKGATTLNINDCEFTGTIGGYYTSGMVADTGCPLTINITNCISKGTQKDNPYNATRNESQPKSCGIFMGDNCGATLIVDAASVEKSFEGMTDKIANTKVVGWNRASTSYGIGTITVKESKLANGSTLNAVSSLILTAK